MKEKSDFETIQNTEIGHVPTELNDIENEQIIDDLSDKIIAGDDFSEIVKQALEKSFASLDERLIKILKMRLGLPPYTRRHSLSEVGDSCGVNKERIHVLQNNAFRKISSVLEINLRKNDYQVDEVIPEGEKGKLALIRILKNI